MNCPCGLQLAYAECCQPLHDFYKFADSAEHLMRSRFAAFYLKNVDYIIKTTAPAQQDLLDKNELQAWADGMSWQNLTVKSHNKVGKRHAQVHFVAQFISRDGKTGEHDERSAFVCVDNRWYFLDPTVPVSLTNKQPCLCGSGEKFKACCGKFL
ncbi:hypothetical protein B0181_03575 [Moraxella caviae]|uniref:SEC-C motif n=2 Tax=Moraxella caviae TaxID=34060 RepID=A0A1T0A615_9GAMM|nr:hypothetical protein B0181_03575 [Moraxella caviae]STZ13789.1 SEC-C motif [Moraxella caviae]VEW13023.1 SEC-C motif [Moraxella caviae]